MSRSVFSLQVLKQIVKQRVVAGVHDGILQKIKVVDGAEGKCVCELRVTQELSNFGGMLHGGATAMLVDSVSTWALLTKTDSVPGVSVNMNISYFKPAPCGSDIVVHAQTLRVGKKLAFLTVDITNKADGSLIAQGTHTKYVGQPKS